VRDMTRNKAKMETS